MTERSNADNGGSHATLVHPKITIGAPNDPLEQEADAVAEQVMRDPSTMAESHKVGDAKQSMHQKRGEVLPPATATGTPRVTLQVQEATLTPGAGAPLNNSIRAQIEPTLGANLSGVRLHNDKKAQNAAAEIQAKAFTNRNNIFLGAGQSPNDLGLIAHEATHVVQQKSTHGTDVLRRDPVDGADTQEAEHEETLPVAAPRLSPVDEGTLIGHGVQISEEDKSRLAALCPNGLRLKRCDVYVTAVGANSVRSTRVDGYRVIEAAPVEGSARVYLFKLNKKGRSIVVSSGAGGNSVMLDAGVGQVQASRSSRDVNALVDAATRLVSSGEAAAPAKVIVSHMDVDHYNAIRAMLSRRQFSSMSVEIAQELISGRQAGAWQNMALNVDRARQLIEVNVTGTSGDVHVSRQVFDGFQLVEFRSVAAHREAQNKLNYSFNRTSAVAVVIDNTSGERFIFTGDATGRQFSEIIDSIGQRAFKRLIGGGAQNLRLFEAPHHGGSVRTIMDARGMLRMLWFTLEASGGQADIVTQTSRTFAQGPSESLSFLELMGIDVRRIEQASGNVTGQSQAERITGRTAETITYDSQSVQRASEIVREHQSQIRAGFEKQTEIDQLRSEFRSARRIMRQFELADSTEGVTAALTTSLTQLDAARNGIRSQLRSVFAEMLNAAHASGMNRSADVSRARAAVQSMAVHASEIALTSHRASLEASTSSMELHQRMMLNTVEMLEASMQENYSRLNGLKTERRNLVRQARAALGNSLVDAHIQKAWEATGKKGAFQHSRVMQEILLRNSGNRSMARLEASRVISGESLGRQMALNRLAELAQHGQLPSSRSSIPVRTQLRGGLMLGLEVGRLGLEFASAMKEASEASERRLLAEQIEGLNAIYWWVSEGAVPHLALVTKSSWSGWNIVSKNFTQEQIQSMLDREINDDSEHVDEDLPLLPEEAKVVIDYVPIKQVVAILSAKFVEFNSLGDFHRWNSSFPSGQLFKEFDGKWGILFWSEDNSRYLYFTMDEIQEPLRELMTSLTEGTNEELGELRNESETLLGVRDTAWLGTDRIVYVYNRYRNLVEVDFDDYNPRFVKVGTRHVGLTEYTVVKAADIGTYLRLYKKGWMVPSTGQRWQFYGASDRSGVSYDEPWNPVHLNDGGFALVEEGDLYVDLGHSIDRTVSAARGDVAGESE